MNSLSIKAKFQIDQCKSLKQIFYKFGGQFDLEVKVKVTIFETVQEVQMINTYLQFEGKIHYGSKIIAVTRNYTKFLGFKVNLTFKVKVTSFQTHPRYLDDQ